MLAVLQSPADRDFVAKRIFDTLADRDGVLPNTGAIARIRVPRADLIGNNQLEELRKRAQDAKGNTISLFTPAEFAQIKPQIAVRGINAFRRDFLIWAGSDSGGVSVDAHRLDRAGLLPALGHFCLCC